MRLTDAELTAWGQEFYESRGREYSRNALAEDAGVNPPTVMYMSRRDDIDPALLLWVARTYRADPVASLAMVDRYAFLGKAPCSPGMRDVLAATDPGFIVTEVGQRLRGAPSCGVDPWAPWSAWPVRLLSWFGYCAPENYRSVLRSMSDITDSSLSSRLRGRWDYPLGELVQGARQLGLDPVFALVVAGYITDDEAGLNPNLRGEVLAKVSDGDLLAAAAHHYRFVQQGTAWSAEAVDKNRVRARPSRSKAK